MTRTEQEARRMVHPWSPEIDAYLLRLPTKQPDRQICMALDQIERGRSLISSALKNLSSLTNQDDN